jgi:prolyl-tRNA editing enzyme YbaK/EbsC (Cys-tRNA(Pro) deacylase)
MHRNAQMVLDAASARGLVIDVVEFPAEGARTAADAAAVIGVEEGQIVKSLVFAVGDPDDKTTGHPVVALVCGDDQLDVDRLAAAAGAQGAWRMDAKAVREATGFPVGGIPPLGHVSNLPTFADTRLRRFATVWGAAGTPSHVFEVGVDALVTATEATWADLAVITHEQAIDAPLAVSHPRPTGRDVLGTVPLTARPPQLSALPSVTARVVAFLAILLGGGMGGLLTFGVMKVWTGRSSGVSVGVWTVIGAVGCAFGVGVLATLVLRAMSEWRSLNRAQELPTVLGG